MINGTRIVRLSEYAELWLAIRARKGHPVAGGSLGTGWYVDDRCTNCDVARQLAPGLISELDGRSVVIRQPRNEVEDGMLLAAAYACHTRSIRHPAGQLGSALDPFPDAVGRSALLVRSRLAAHRGGQLVSAV